MDEETAQQMLELVEWVRDTLSWGLAAGCFGSRAAALHLKGRSAEAHVLLAEQLKINIKTVLASVAGNRPGAFIDVGHGAFFDASDLGQRAQLITATLRRALELAETVD